MDDIRARLERVFAAVFPDLPADEIPRASPVTVAAWDSLANVTLVSVVEEEFGVELPLEELDSLGSFELILAYLNESLHVA